MRDEPSEAKGKPIPNSVMKLQVAMLQSMFPALDLSKINLKQNCKRVVMFHYDAKQETIEMRHYVIKLSHVGVNKVVKKLATGRIANLSRLEDISQVLDDDLCLSDSGIEDLPESHVSSLPTGKKTQSAGKSAVRLKEIGPRISLQLLKMEEGFLTGEVLYDRYSNKSKEEIAKLRTAKKEAAILKKQRREMQEQNVEKKKRLNKTYDTKPNVEDDDAQYFREATGEEPEPGMFSKAKKKTSWAN